MDLSSESSSDTSSYAEESEEEQPTIATLRPYEFEPVEKITGPISPSSSSGESEEEENSRIGNTEWCLCEKCEAMETYTESLCCQDTNEVPEDYFEGKIYIY